MPHAPNHSLVALHFKQALKKLPFRCDRLVHPCKHVADVPKRVMRMQLYRTG